MILFFAIAAAVCTNVFVKAKQTGVQSTDLTNAVVASQRAAETFRAEHGDPQAAGARLGAADAGSRGFTLYFDRDWKQTDEAESAVYTLSLEKAESSSLQTAEIVAFRGEDEIYRLETAVLGAGL